MKVTILGSSSFVSLPDRYGPSFLLEIGNKKMLVDTGSGSQIRLAQLGISIKDIDYIFITHFHPDHTTDLSSFYVRYAQVVKKESQFNGKLTIFGPKGIKKFIDDILTISDLAVLIGRPGARVKEISKLIDDDFKATAFKTEHMGITSQGYRFEADGKSVVFTGDTTIYPNLVKDCKEADLLFIDSSLSESEEPKAHLNTALVAEVCTEAHVKKVILCHILGYNADKDLKSEVKKAFRGEIVQAIDLMTFDL